MRELEKILEEIDNRVHFYDNADEPMMYVETVKKIISKHMNDEWIPVEERLPETGEHVLVSFRDDGFLPAVVIIQEDGKWLMLQGAKGFNDVTDDVTAWQPLPEQYRPERSE